MQRTWEGGQVAGASHRGQVQRTGEGVLALNVSTTGLRLAVDSAVDLHLHTTFSDGRWTLEPLLDHLLREGFGLAAIADHDRVDTVAAVQQRALEKRLPVLVAVEMSARWNGEMTDLLCFGFDPDHTTLNDPAQDLLRRQQENSREVCLTCSIPEVPLSRNFPVKHPSIFVRLIGLLCGAILRILKPL